MDTSGHTILTKKEIGRHDLLKRSNKILEDMEIDFFQEIKEFLETAIWLQQLEALFIIVGIPISLFKLFFPRLRVYFDPKETYHEVSLVNYDGTPQQGNPISFWIHAMVKNKAFGESKKAVVYLQEVWELVGKSYKPLNNFNVALVLKWSHEKYVVPKNILPRAKRRVDMGHIQNNSSIFVIETEHFPSGTIRDLGLGHYLFVLVATADNTIFPSREILKVTWNGIYKNLECNYFVHSFRRYTQPVKSFRLYGKRIFK